MPAKKISHNQLLEISADLIRINGFHNTSIDDIAKACQLRKSSIYHHVHSKSDLINSIVVNIINYFDKNIFKYGYQSELTIDERLSKYIAAIEDYYVNKPGGCLVGNLTLEMIDTTENLKVLFDRFFTNWVNAIKSMLLFSYSEEEAMSLAKNVVAQTQGAIMLARVFQNYDVLKQVHKNLKQYFLQ